MKLSVVATGGPWLQSRYLYGRSPDGATASGLEVFSDITKAAGITWKHFSGESPDRFLIEAMGGGVGFFDFDGDGLLDLYFVNGGETPRGRSETPVRNALYRNLGNGHFVDVAHEAGVDSIPFYGMGVAAADYDNDGFQDLFVTGYPSCALFHNTRHGTFTNVTQEAGVDNSGRWAAGAAWFDYDRDGYLDLIICNYARFSFSSDHSPFCDYENVRTYCEQKAYEGMPLTLYHNNGNGTFTDVSTESGVARHVGRALGVVSIDVNNDGWPDLFVARDASPNLLLINRHDGTFVDAGLDAEVAYDENGAAKAGMGVDAGDANGDGWPDFVVTNFSYEFHSLFLNPGSFPYEDWTVKSRLAQYTKSYVGWGIQFIDYDNDGTLDLILVNGHVNPLIGLMSAGLSYKEPPVLLKNNGEAFFQNVSGQAGPAFHTGYVARGLAVGDFDNDGDPDVVFTRLNNRPVLLQNAVGQNAAWVGFELTGRKSSRDAIGARLILRAGERKLFRWITGGSSYLATHDKRVLFGLGKAERLGTVDVEIRWPSGILQTVSGLGLREYHRITEPYRS